MRSNFNTRFKDAHLYDLMWKADKALQISKFDGLMMKIRNANEDTGEYLNNIQVEQRTLAHDGGR